MAIKFDVKYRKLEFLFEAGTSRGILKHKKTWFIRVYDESKPSVCGIGEAGPLKGLSIDDIDDFEDHLNEELNRLGTVSMPVNQNEVFDLARNISDKMPSVRFGVETAFLDLLKGGKRAHFDNDFYAKGKPIRINGLIWMGDSKLMLNRLEEKMSSGFGCIKIKIGAISFDEELQLLQNARKRFPETELELRVDANGGFSYDQVLQVLRKLKELGVHSIEQPIKAGQVDLMAKLCEQTPVPIALDEELIGVVAYADKEQLLGKIKPQYIILKPSLLGGFASCLEWIEIAEKTNIGWWVTSALESNIGLNAICQFTSWLDVSMPQGLGTGGLYKNNIQSPLTVEGENIFYDSNLSWGNVMG